MCKKISKPIQISAEKNQWKFAIFGNQKKNKKIEKWFWAVSGTDFPIFVCFSANFVEKIPTQKVEISVQKSVIKKKIRQDLDQKIHNFRSDLRIGQYFLLKISIFLNPKGPHPNHAEFQCQKVKK